LNHLLKLFLGKLAEEFFIKHWHLPTFLLLRHQLLEDSMLVVLSQMRNCIQLAFLASGDSLFG